MRTSRTATCRTSGSGYRKLAVAETYEAVEEVRAELVDRYGEPGEAVEILLAVARFRVLARRAGVTEVSAQGNHIRLAPVGCASRNSCG